MYAYIHFYMSDFELSICFEDTETFSADRQMDETNQYPACTQIYAQRVVITIRKGKSVHDFHHCMICFVLLTLVIQTFS